jgi:hypothetical protein
MFDYRRIALWLAVLVIPGGLVLLPLLLADLRRQKNAKKPIADNPTAAPKTPNDDPGRPPRTPDDGPTPRLAA